MLWKEERGQNWSLSLGAVLFIVFEVGKTSLPLSFVSFNLEERRS